MQSILKPAQATEAGKKSRYTNGAALTMVVFGALATIPGVPPDIQEAAHTVVTIDNAVNAGVVPTVAAIVGVFTSPPKLFVKAGRWFKKTAKRLFK